MASTASNPILFVACVTMLVFGTMSVVMKDWQVKLGFYEPHLWTWATFVGQSFFLPIFYCSARRADDRGHGCERKKPPAPFHAYALVTFFDYAFMALLNVAYSGLPGSILQMLKGLKLIFTFVLSGSVLGKTMRSHQYLGVSITFAGVVLVGMAATEGTGTGWAGHGAALASLSVGICSCLVGAMQFIWEEKTMKQYAVEPELLTGMEGVIGVVYGTIALVVVGALKVDNVPGAFAEMWHRMTILYAFVLFLFAVAIFNYAALVVTSNSSAMGRSLLDVARTCCVWVTEIFCHWDKFLWAELLGFAIMIAGMMIYSKHLKVPCLAYEEEGPLLPVKQDQTEK